MVLFWFIHAYIPRSIRTLSHPHLQSQTTRNHSKKMRNPSAPAASSNNNNNNGSIRTPCCTKVGLKRGPWTPEEDELLSTYITREGEGRWRTLPKRAGLLRCGKSCRLRWMNYLRPSVKRGHIAPDEEDLILRLHRLLGNRWSLIAGRIPGRTDNEIKNYWNTHLSKKLISQGIDPRTHKPLSQSDLRQLAPASNPNPNPNLEKDDGGGDEHGHVQSYCSEESSMDKPQGGATNFDDEERDHRIDDARIDNDGSGMMMMMMGFEGGHGSMKQGDDMDCCSDDIFSSFLNSLINDEVFVQQQQQQQQQQQGSGEGLVSAPGFGYGPFWDSTISSAPGVKGEEHGLGFVENASKRF